MAYTHTQHHINIHLRIQVPKHTYTNIHIHTQPLRHAQCTSHTHIHAHTHTHRQCDADSACNYGYKCCPIKDGCHVCTSAVDVNKGKPIYCLCHCCCCYCCGHVIGVRVVVEVGATCGNPGHHGIEARRRAWVDRFSSAPWVHDHPVGY